MLESTKRWWKYTGSKSCLSRTWLHSQILRVSKEMIHINMMGGGGCRKHEHSGDHSHMMSTMGGEIGYPHKQINNLCWCDKEASVIIRKILQTSHMNFHWGETSFRCIISTSNRTSDTQLTSCHGNESQPKWKCVNIFLGACCPVSCLSLLNFR